jgi:hypothetical protein
MIPMVLAALLIGGAVGAAVVNHDDNRDDRVVQITTQPAEPGQTPQVVTIDGGDHWRGGFFPFGFIFPLLWIGLIIFLISFLWRGGRGRGGPGGWEGRFEEWHRRQHQSGNNEPPATGASSV